MFKLRDYQRDTISATVESYDKNISKQLITLATGLGKTVIATNIVKTFREKFISEGKPHKALFLVDQIDLVDQSYNSFKRSDPNLRIGIEQSDRKIDREVDLVIACVPTIGRENSKRILKFKEEEFGIILTDEAHKAVSDTWIRVLNYFAVGPVRHNPEKLLLGLTATPNRTDGVKLGKLYDDITVNYDLPWAIKNGWLTDIEVFNVQTTTDISHVKTRKGEFAPGELNDAVNNAVRNAQILKAYKEYADGERAFVYCASVAHAYELEKIFNHQGISSGVIEANTDKAYRKHMLEQHKNGELPVLFNHSTLTTGVDSPNTSTLILARPIKSELIYRQIIGRGLRPHPSAQIDTLGMDAHIRRFLIEDSIKPACKVIDLEDVTGSHGTMSVPTLFGLSRKIAAEKPRFFKDVVEVVEAKEHELGVDLSQIEDLTEIDLIVERRKGNLGSLETPREIHSFTDNAWIELGEDHYELNLSSSNVSMIVVKNQLEQYEVREYKHKEKQTMRLQSFNNLSGAFQLADAYAKENYDTRYQNRKAEWRGQGVTTKQFRLLTQMLRGGIRVDHHQRYEDTGNPFVSYKGEILDRGSASALLSKLFANK